ncbi:MAG: EVE domain-containing protein [Patescibacteria group bacterium]
MKYWLIKSEGDCYSIDDFKKDKRTAWTGIRNFQARNYMKEMKVGDLALFYHSSSEPSGIYGVAKVVALAHEDETSLDPNDEHYDPKSIMYQFEGKGPLWECVDVAFVQKLEKPISLEMIKKDKELKKMLVAQTGQRLSVMPVEEGHFKRCLMSSK